MVIVQLVSIWFLLYISAVSWLLVEMAKNLNFKCEWCILDMGVVPLGKAMLEFPQYI